jgi:DNA-binding CsgD family transcriptional regulator
MRFLRRAKTGVDTVHEKHENELKKAAAKRQRQREAAAWTRPPSKRRGRPQPMPPPQPPSRREIEVLDLIAEGLTNAEIGGMLHLSEETVKSHVRHLIAKMQARNRAHLVALGYETGLLTTTSPTPTSSPSPESHRISAGESRRTRGAR